MQRRSMYGQCVLRMEGELGCIRQMCFSMSRALPSSLDTKELGYLFGLRKLAN